MKSFQMLPVAALRPFVDRYWGWEAVDDTPLALPSLLPGTGAELYLHYRAPFRYQLDASAVAECRPGHLFCLRRRGLALLPSAHVGFVAVRFRAGMLQRFTAVPGAELLDQVLAVEDIWGAAGRNLLARLESCTDLSQRIAVIQTFLLAQLRCESEDWLVEQAVALLYRQSATLSVQDLAAALDIGRRQLERRFLAATGQTPGEFRGACRFQHTLRQMLLSAAAKPVDVALANGYYDQAHFIRDFRRRANAAPQQWLRDAAGRTHFYNTSRSAARMLMAPIHLDER